MCQKNSKFNQDFFQVNLAPAHHCLSLQLVLSNLVSPLVCRSHGVVVAIVAVLVAVVVAVVVVVAIVADAIVAAVDDVAAAVVF